jgi:uncharacterized protein YwgA
MAAKNSTSVAKPLVYDLLSRLNSSFSRVNRNLSTLEQTRIFNPATMKTISRLSKELQADANHHLLETLQEIETRDRARFGKAKLGKVRASRPRQ